MDEQIYQQRPSHRQVRPFVGAARVPCRSLSVGLQRAVVDFGADSSFAAAVEKVREHYGVEVSASAVRAVTEGPGAALQMEPEVTVRLPREGVRELLAEIDGTLVPVVEVGEALRGASASNAVANGKRRGSVWPGNRRV